MAVFMLSVAPLVKTTSAVLRTKGRRRLLACQIYGGLRFPPEDMRAGSVAIVPRKVRQHAVQHATVQGRGGVVVKVNRTLHSKDTVRAERSFGLAMSLIGPFFRQNGLPGGC